MTTPTMDLIASFRDEVAEQLDELAQALESMPTLSAVERQVPLTRCRQLAHNIKGISATVGLDALTNLTHAFESILKRVEKTQDPSAKPPIGLLLRCVTLMQRLSEGDLRPAECTGMLERLREHCLEADQEAVGKAITALAPTNGTAGEGSDAGDAKSEATAKGGPHREATTVSVRVETARLDRVMGSIGELLVTHSRLAARNESVERLYHSFKDSHQRLAVMERAEFAPLVRQFEQLLQNDRKELLAFGNLSQALSTAMKQVRMMPLANLAPVWRRLVREAAQELGKLVDLQIEVGGIELDKFVLERVRDPMIHILRNAVAHGIESGEDRALQGKRPAGQIVIHARMHGAMVALEVSDDGRGLDAGHVAEAAIRKGLRTAAELEGRTRDQIVELIFEAGFSTAETVNRVSGRGVGLDVVRQYVEELHGSVAIVQPPLLGGATFRLTLPLSVLSNKGLLVRAQQTIYALPIEHVIGSLRVRSDQIRCVEGVPVFQQREEEPLPIRSLAAMMQPGAQTKPELGAKLKIVALSSGAGRLGVIVDDVLRDEEFVVKKLPWNLRAVPGVNGAVILADGTLAVAVDVDWLFQPQKGGWGSRHTEPGPDGEAGAPGRQRTLRVLVVDDSATSRALERNTLTAAGHEVMVAVNGAHAWQILQKDTFDVVVSDVMMPEMNGFELTAKIRKDYKLTGLPIILVTSLGRDTDIAAGVAAGANEYLIKGKFDQQKLVEAVARYS